MYQWSLYILFASWGWGTPGTVLLADSRVSTVQAFAFLAMEGDTGTRQVAWSGGVASVDAWDIWAVEKVVAVIELTIPGTVVVAFDFVGGETVSGSPSVFAVNSSTLATSNRSTTSVVAVGSYS